MDGPTDSVLTLADGLALKVLHEIWRSKEPLPSARSSAITSGSMEAIRAYLDGEKWYRRGQWDSAQVAYEHAVHADTAFAIAWYKLATHARMGGAGGHADRGAHRRRECGEVLGVAAAARSDASWWHTRCSSAAGPKPSIRCAATPTLHPEDADGWYLLGEAQYHTRNYHPLPRGRTGRAVRSRAGARFDADGRGDSSDGSGARGARHRRWRSVTSGCSRRRTPTKRRKGASEAMALLTAPTPALRH